MQGSYLLNCDLRLSDSLKSVTDIFFAISVLIRRVAVVVSSIHYILLQDELPVLLGIFIVIIFWQNSFVLQQPLNILLRNLLQLLVHSDEIMLQLTIKIDDNCRHVDVSEVLDAASRHDLQKLHVDMDLRQLEKLLSDQETLFIIVLEQQQHDINTLRSIIHLLDVVLLRDFLYSVILRLLCQFLELFLSLVHVSPQERVIKLVFKVL
mmetsp:Transcript_18631/g.21437  ORF Transcript_18631/g.21437 Transcript_18631/m.21437 type:complete len:208 (-) Transcript_18631:183-806(-)